jgi:hypothetical protein
MTSDVCAQFREAGLALAVETDPIERWGLRPVEIVQLDIARRRGVEWFRLFRGAPANEVSVTASDGYLHQVVLSVREARRAYRAQVEGKIEEIFTLGSPQHYLCGVDEEHLFMAQLPRGAGSIVGAHRLLAPDVPIEYSRQPRVRQGEWFFFDATAPDAIELDRLDRLGYGAKHEIGIAEGAKIRRLGRPHVASELRLLKPGKRIFVRGLVRHPDHATVRLRDWHFVLPNREVANRRTRWCD